MTWREEYAAGLADTAAALHRIADELALGNAIAMHNGEPMSRAEAAAYEYQLRARRLRATGDTTPDTMDR